jgi:CoA:oxalate CoA-transferase
METRATSKLLDGIRVLDLSRVMSGPYCTAMLADLGAEVIKIEIPGRGDDARHFGPYKDGESAYFLLLNRGKKSLTVDLKSPEGVALVQDIARKSDVVVENFRPGVAKRLGLDYATLADLKPDLVYASISGFGQESPLADRPALDLAIQAMSGLMSMTGPKEGGPYAVGESMADVTTGMFCAFGIMAALFERERSGKGRYLEVAMLDACFSMLLTGLSRQLYLGETPRRVGNRHPESYPVDLFPTKTGDVVIVVPNDAVFRSFAEAIGQPELAEDARFSEYAPRSTNDDALRAIITEWTQDRTSDEVVELMSARSIPCAPVWSLGDLATSDHARERDLVVEGRHSGLGTVPVVPQPVRFSDAAAGDTPTMPGLGEDTGAVLRDVLGLSDEEIAALAERNIV